MGTIDQPKPTEPKSPQGGQQPLQPGGPQVSNNTSIDPQRPNIQTPDDQEDNIRGGSDNRR